ncbi:phosphopantetheine-binding protein, partial [Bacillus velezensis]
ENGLRHGKTVAFNWTLWKDGGMQAGDETERMMKKAFGMVPLQKASGLAAFYEGMAQEKPQLLASEGHAAKLKQSFLSVSETEKPQVQKIEPVSAVSGDKWHGALIRLVSSILKVGQDEIDIDTELSEYGFDSVSFTVFTNQLNEAYQLELAPTIFFEYGTISGLAGYLAKEHPGRFGEKQKESPKKEQPKAQKPKMQRKKRFATVMNASAATQEPRRFDPVAIVGISGRFPGAKDI